MLEPTLLDDKTLPLSELEGALNAAEQFAASQNARVFSLRKGEPPNDQANEVTYEDVTGPVTPRTFKLEAFDPTLDDDALVGEVALVEVKRGWRACRVTPAWVLNEIRPIGIFVPAPVVTPSNLTATPKLPDYARDRLSAAQGVPWGKARRLPEANGYVGIIPDSFHVFSDLTGMPNGVSRAVIYECKFGIDNDGVGGNAAGDRSHQGETSLRDGNGRSLDASRDSFAVLPLDAAEALATRRNIALKRAELPELGKDCGLRLGDLGVAYWREGKSGAVRQAFFIYADKGPANDLGEGSVQMAKLLGINSNPNSGGYNAKDVAKMGKGVIHIGFVGSGAAFMAGSRKSSLVPGKIDARAREYLDAFLGQPPASRVQDTNQGTTQSTRARLVDRSDLPKCAMDHVVCHWSEGHYVANDTDLAAYHILIEGNGRIRFGKKSIADNLSTRDGVYAAHTKGWNTRTIGVACCCMVGCKENPLRVGSEPLKKLQWDVMTQVVAELCSFYGIPVTSKTVVGHGEVQQNVGVLQDGKWDPMVWPWDTSVSRKAVGVALREQVQQHLDNLSSGRIA